MVDQQRPDLFQRQVLLAQQKGYALDLSKKSRDFFRKQAASLSVRGSLPDQVRRERLKTRPVIGKMYFYSYDPKTKEKLKYYDKLPLVIPIEPYKDGFLGLNLHYLPPVLRARLFDALIPTLTNKNLDDRAKFRVSYLQLTQLARVKYFRLCLKRYLFNHVRSPFVEIAPIEWNTAIMLPVAQFQKARQRTVWQDARKQSKAYWY